MTARHKSHGHTGTKSHAPSSNPAPPPPAQPSTSFLFIVNELPTNDDPEIAGFVAPRYVDQRWRPPIVAQGFFAQEPGHVYRWRNGAVSLAEGYRWIAQPITNPTLYANGTIYKSGPDNRGLDAPQPQYYRAATVFYCNRFDQFFTARGDVGTRDIATSDPEEGWQPLTFHHNGNISRVEYAGDQDFLAVRRADWIPQIIPHAYRHESPNGPTQGGLGGLLPIVIALIAFSCPPGRDNLRRILIHDRSWRNYRWHRHNQDSGCILGRGVVATICLDPDNPDGSTYDRIEDLEYGNAPIFR